ncbi:hypothetical protein CB1_000199008 [Camelus ferus]|nr:hypothetical protein CB1_000199008 [Camelus ferus]
MIAAMIPLKNVRSEVELLLGLMTRCRLRMQPTARRLSAIFIMTPKFNPKEIKIVDLVCMDGKVDADSALAPKSAPRCAFRKAGSDIAKRISDWKHLDSSEIDSEWKDPK